MKTLLLTLALLPLGGGFGEATAEATPLGDQMEVELVVEVGTTTSSVVAHIVVGGDTQLAPVALDHRSGGVFGGFVTLPIQDAVVVFERIDFGGGELSQPVTLAALGADLDQFGDGVDFVDPVEDTRRRGDGAGWLWLAVAAGAAAVSALAFWVFMGGGGQDSEGESADEDSSVDTTPPPESD